ncbi:fungal cellulose binding domain-containing protein [Apiospora hydei]|uniref:Fungal cellulose binding domain-containing protein n=1 Tax=Apiospora hydei TaxID=1337664 RepID=A0ABR1WNK2_9PEZI
MSFVSRSQLLLALLASGVDAAPAQLNPRCTASTDWPGWNGIKHAFVLYVNSLSRPPRYTSSNGPNWVDYLTVKYNASLLQTYNLAVGGATMDSDLVKPYLPTVLSVKQQVQDVFLPSYASSSSSSSSSENGPIQWSASDSLFAFWIGINDVGNSYWQDDTAGLNRQIFAVYADVVRQLYDDAGARNFLFLNVPPVDRSPLTLGQGAAAADREAADIAAFNALTAELAANLATATAAGAEEGAEGRMFGLMTGTPNLDTLDPACGIPVNEYFWLNSLHPTYPMHDVVAEQVAAALEKGPNAAHATTAALLGWRVAAAAAVALGGRGGPSAPPATAKADEEQEGEEGNGGDDDAGDGAAGQAVTACAPGGLVVVLAGQEL